MRMTTENIPVVLAEYLDQVLIPKSTSSTQTFMSALVVGMAGQRVKAMASAFADAEGKINLDELRQAADEAIRRAGSVDIPMLGYRADAEDIARLFEIANRHGE